MTGTQIDTQYNNIVTIVSKSPDMPYGRIIDTNVINETNLMNFLFSSSFSTEFIDDRTRGFMLKRTMLPEYTNFRRKFVYYDFLNIKHEEEPHLNTEIVEVDVSYYNTSHIIKCYFLLDILSSIYGHLSSRGTSGDVVTITSKYTLRDNEFILYTEKDFYTFDIRYKYDINGVSKYVIENVNGNTSENVVNICSIFSDDIMKHLNYIGKKDVNKGNSDYLHNIQAFYKFCKLKLVYYTLLSAKTYNDDIESYIRKELTYAFINLKNSVQLQNDDSNSILLTNKLITTQNQLSLINDKINTSNNVLKKNKKRARVIEEKPTKQILYTTLFVSCMIFVSIFVIYMSSTDNDTSSIFDLAFILIIVVLFILVKYVVKWNSPERFNNPITYQFPRKAAIGNNFAYDDIVTTVRISSSGGTNDYTVFDRNSGTSWTSAASTYSNGDATRVYYNDYKGEYICIDLGEQITLKNYNLRLTNSTNAPKNFRIYGTNDDGAWGNPSHASWKVAHEIQGAVYTNNVASFDTSKTIETMNIGGYDGIIAAGNIVKDTKVLTIGTRNYVFIDNKNLLSDIVKINMGVHGPIYLRKDGRVLSTFYSTTGYPGYIFDKDRRPISNIVDIASLGRISFTYGSGGGINYDQGANLLTNKGEVICIYRHDKAYYNSNTYLLPLCNIENEKMSSNNLYMIYDPYYMCDITGTKRLTNVSKMAFGTTIGFLLLNNGKVLLVTSVVHGKKPTLSKTPFYLKTDTDQDISNITDIHVKQIYDFYVNNTNVRIENEMYVYSSYSHETHGNGYHAKLFSHNEDKLYNFIILNTSYRSGNADVPYTIIFAQENSEYLRFKKYIKIKKLHLLNHQSSLSWSFINDKGLLYSSGIFTILADVESKLDFFTKNNYYMEYYNFTVKQIEQAKVLYSKYYVNIMPAIIWNPDIINHGDLSKIKIISNIVCLIDNFGITSEGNVFKLGSHISDVYLRYHYNIFMEEVYNKLENKTIPITNNNYDDIIQNLPKKYNTSTNKYELDTTKKALVYSFKSQSHVEFIIDNLSENGYLNVKSTIDDIASSTSGSGQTMTFETPNTVVPYRYYSLVPNKLTGNATQVQLSEWEMYGQYAGDLKSKFLNVFLPLVREQEQKVAQAEQMLYDAQQKVREKAQLEQDNALEIQRLRDQLKNIQDQINAVDMGDIQSQINQANANALLKQIEIQQAEQRIQQAETDQAIQEQNLAAVNAAKQEAQLTQIKLNADIEFLQNIKRDMIDLQTQIQNAITTGQDTIDTLNNQIAIERTNQNELDIQIGLARIEENAIKVLHQERNAILLQNSAKLAEYLLAIQTETEYGNLKQAEREKEAEQQRLNEKRMQRELQETTRDTQRSLQEQKQQELNNLSENLMSLNSDISFTSNEINRFNLQNTTLQSEIQANSNLYNTEIGKLNNQTNILIETKNNEIKILDDKIKVQWQIMGEKTAEIQRAISEIAIYDVEIPELEAELLQIAGQMVDKIKELRRYKYATKAIGLDATIKDINTKISVSINNTVTAISNGIVLSSLYREYYSYKKDEENLSTLSHRSGSNLDILKREEMIIEETIHFVANVVLLTSILLILNKKSQFPLLTIMLSFSPFYTILFVVYIIEIIRIVRTKSTNTYWQKPREKLKRLQ